MHIFYFMHCFVHIMLVYTNKLLVFVYIFSFLLLTKVVLGLIICPS